MTTSRTAFDVDRAWRASPSTALRPEPFGALAYDFTTRRLSFLKSLRLVEVVKGLEQAATAREAMTAAGVTEAEWASYTRALENLAGSGLVVPR